MTFTLCVCVCVCARAHEILCVRESVCLAKSVCTRCCKGGQEMVIDNYAGSDTKCNWADISQLFFLMQTCIKNK